MRYEDNYMIISKINLLKGKRVCFGLCAAGSITWWKALEESPEVTQSITF